MNSRILKFPGYNYTSSIQFLKDSGIIFYLTAPRETPCGSVWRNWALNLNPLPYLASLTFFVLIFIFYSPPFVMIDFPNGASRVCMYFSNLTSAFLSCLSPCLSSPLINSCVVPHGTSPFRQGGVVDSTPLKDTQLLRCGRNWAVNINPWPYFTSSSWNKPTASTMCS